MDCPKCGAAPEDAAKFAFDSWACESWHSPASDRFVESLKCCRRQLAAAKETETTLRSALAHQQDKRIEAEHALAACDQSPWRGMESAPKEEPILAIVEGGRRLVMWTKTSHVPLWGWCLIDQGVEDCDLCEPTHWMPLPEAPRKDET